MAIGKNIRKVTRKRKILKSKSKDKESIFPPAKPKELLREENGWLTDVDRKINNRINGDLKHIDIITETRSVWLKFDSESGPVVQCRMLSNAGFSSINTTRQCSGVMPPTIRAFYLIQENAHTISSATAPTTLCQEGFVFFYL